MKDDGSLRGIKRSGIIVRGKLIQGGLGRWLAVATWMALIFFLSAQPALPSSGEGWLDDLIHVASHFVEYGVLATLASRAIFADGRRTRARMALVLSWCVVYAVGDEWHQGFVPGREASVVDLAVDVLGVLGGLRVYIWVAKGDAI